MAKKNPTYRAEPIPLRYFRIYEFDSRDQPGTGELMRTSTLRKLDDARHRAGIAFRVNSGYRTARHNRAVGGVPGSAHTRGYAADIKAPTLEVQRVIVRALREAGFTRFGIYPTWIHVDDDPGKTGNLAWNHRNKVVRRGGDFSADFPFDPFTIGAEPTATGLIAGAGVDAPVKNAGAQD